MKVDPTNPESLKKFFKEYRGLTSAELAILVDRTVDTIREWRKKCNEEIQRDPFVNWRKKQTKQAKPEIVRPEVWDCAEWFKEQYEEKEHGVRIISGIIRKNLKFTYYRLKKYGIKLRSNKEATKSNNPCCEEDWLYYHYARREEYLEWCDKNGVKPDEFGGMGLTLTECAELAGVVPYTITNWLTRFKLRIRGITESSMLNKVITNAQRRAARDKFFEICRKNNNFNVLQMVKQKNRNSKTDPSSEGS